MGWETRNGRRYYYEKRREGGRVVSRYHGTGTLGELVAICSQADIGERAQQRAAMRAEREAVDGLAGDVATICDGIDTLTRAVLILAGYHQHERGHWRKRRKAVDMATSKTIVKTDDHRQALENEVIKVIDPLIEKANKGDAKAMKELQPFIQAVPSVFECYGDMAALVRSAIIQKITGNGKLLLLNDRIRARLQEMEKDLSGQSPTPIERLLVERIVTCWLEVQWYDYLYTTSGNVTLNQGDYYQRRQDRAHKRYLTAIKSLAQVRRLTLPAVQVNIAGQQVNTQAVFTSVPE